MLAVRRWCREECLYLCQSKKYGSAITADGSRGQEGTDKTFRQLQKLFSIDMKNSYITIRRRRVSVHSLFEVCNKCMCVSLGVWKVN